MKNTPKKKPEKSSAKKPADDRSRQFDDIGLEPPKIYRDTQAYRNQQKQRQAQSAPKRKSRREPENLTRQERRARESKRRKKKNLLRKIILWFVFIMGILGVGVVLSLTMFFSITEITVQNNERYTTEEIISQCPIDVGENLFMADTKNASELLERNLPYIYNAEIKRKLPDKLLINITECEPSYYIINEDETYLLLDDNFKVLETSAQEGSGMRLDNAELAVANAGQVAELADENVYASLQTMAQCLKDNSFTQFTGMYSYGLTENYLVYDNRITFKLGTTEELEKKIFQGLATCEKLDETTPNVEGELNITGGKQIYFTEK